MKTRTKNIPVKFPEKWEKNAEAFTGNELIDAYLKGKEAGKNEEKKNVRKILHNNIHWVTEVSEKLFKKIAQQNIKLHSIHLKADTVSDYTVLFVADLDDYVSDKFQSAYFLANELKNEVRKDNVDIYFSFTHNSPNPRYDSLVADGFFLKYE